MANFEQFPWGIKPTNQSFHLLSSTKFGPLLPDGRQQRIDMGSRVWLANLSYMLPDAWEVREFRAYVTKMAGGANEFIMPVHDRKQAPWPSGVTWETAKAPIVWDDTRAWVTGWNNRYIKVIVTSTQPAGLTYLEVESVKSGTLRRGNHFSVKDRAGRPRLYQIDEVPRGISDGQSGTIHFQPPLRAQVREGQYLDFDDPQCTMTLAEPDSGRVMLEGGQPARVDLSLRESFGGV